MVKNHLKVVTQETARMNKFFDRFDNAHEVLFSAMDAMMSTTPISTTNTALRQQVQTSLQNQATLITTTANALKNVTTTTMTGTAILR